MNAWFFGNLDDEIFWKKWWWWFFFFFWKWMRHGQMPLVWNMNSWKNFDLINFLKTMMEAMIFENKWVRHVRMPQFDQKRSFWVLNSPKKNVQERKIAWMYEGGATSHLAHASWWANSSYFPNACFAFSCFSKNIFFVCDHETLSYLATNSMKPISNLIKNWCSSYKWCLLWQISHLKPISAPKLGVCLIWDGFWGLWKWWVVG